MSNSKIYLYTIIIVLSFLLIIPLLHKNRPIRLDEIFNKKTNELGIFLTQTWCDSFSGADADIQFNSAKWFADGSSEYTPIFFVWKGKTKQEFVYFGIEDMIFTKSGDSWKWKERLFTEKKAETKNKHRENVENEISDLTSKCPGEYFRRFSR